VSALVQHEKPPLVTVATVANSALSFSLVLEVAKVAQAVASSEQFQFQKAQPVAIAEGEDEVAQSETLVVLCEGKEWVPLSVEEADCPSSLG
jgi:hypothetical protein